MALLKFHKVLSLPGTLEAHALYLVENGSYAETYLTNAAGIPKMVGNSAMINALINSAINTALADVNMIQIVANIAARNALGSASTRNLLILVLDATGDTTVTSGSALYAYNETGSVYTKLSEFESLDTVVDWANISGKPSSSAAQIDSAVSASHSHTNKAQLDKISESGGVVTYDGNPIPTTLNTANW